MMNIASFTRNASWFSLGISVAVVLLFGAAMVQSSTTISTNISTGGTLAVTGASTLTGAVSAAGAVWASSTAQVTGATRLYSTLEVTDTTTLTGDVTLSGGASALTLTTSNSATSSAVVGCIQTYPTSSATVVRIGFFASTTPYIDGTAVSSSWGPTPSGFVVFNYGACP